MTHTRTTPKKPNSGASQKYLPYVFSENTGLGFMLVGAAGVAGRRAEPCNQHLQPIEISAMYSRRIRRVGVLAGSAAWIFGVSLLSFISACCCNRIRCESPCGQRPWPEG